MPPLLALEVEFGYDVDILLHRVLVMTRSCVEWIMLVERACVVELRLEHTAVDWISSLSNCHEDPLMCRVHWVCLRNDLLL